MVARAAHTTTWRSIFWSAAGETVDYTPDGHIYTFSSHLLASSKYLKIGNWGMLTLFSRTLDFRSEIFQHRAGLNIRPMFTISRSSLSSDFWKSLASLETFTSHLAVDSFSLEKFDFFSFRRTSFTTLIGTRCRRWWRMATDSSPPTHVGFRVINCFELNFRGAIRLTAQLNSSLNSRWNFRVSEAALLRNIQQYSHYSQTVFKHSPMLAKLWSQPRCYHKIIQELTHELANYESHLIKFKE